VVYSGFAVFRSGCFHLGRLFPRQSADLLGEVAPVIGRQLLQSCCLPESLQPGYEHSCRCRGICLEWVPEQWPVSTGVTGKMDKR